jgi:polar amino acid transport system substrate-binding protein
MALTLALLTTAPVPISAQQTAAPENQAGARELVVGTKEAPPFAIKDDQGNWSGISIELWRKIADRLKLRYRFVDVVSVPSLLENVESGDFDVAVAAITITPERQQQVDFSTPYFHTGTGVAVEANRITSWGPVIRSIASFRFFAGGNGLAWPRLSSRHADLAVRTPLQRKFRRRNGARYQFGCLVVDQHHDPARGRRLGSGDGAGPGGRDRLDGRVGHFDRRFYGGHHLGVDHQAPTWRGQHARRFVGGAGWRSAGNLDGRCAGADADQIQDRGVAEGRLRSIAGRNNRRPGLRPTHPGMDDPSGRVFVDQLTDVTFEQQSYAIALPFDSALRKSLNVALLEVEESDWWKDTMFRYLGQATN